MPGCTAQLKNRYGFLKLAQTDHDARDWDDLFSR